MRQNCERFTRGLAVTSRLTLSQPRRLPVSPDSTWLLGQRDDRCNRIRGVGEQSQYGDGRRALMDLGESPLFRPTRDSLCGVTNAMCCIARGVERIRLQADYSIGRKIRWERPRAHLLCWRSRVK